MLSILLNSTIKSHLEHEFLDLDNSVIIVIFFCYCLLRTDPSDSRLLSKDPLLCSILYQYFCWSRVACACPVSHDLSYLMSIFISRIQNLLQMEGLCPSSSDEIRPVVLLLPWLFAKPKHVKKFDDLYDSMGKHVSAQLYTHSF